MGFVDDDDRVQVFGKNRLHIAEIDDHAAALEAHMESKRREDNKKPSTKSALLCLSSSQFGLDPTTSAKQCARTHCI